MMMTPEQDKIDYKFLYQSLMKQKENLVKQHRLLGNHVKQQKLRIAELEQDAARYRWLMANYARGDGWQQIDDALNYGEADTKLSPAIDAAMQKDKTT